MHRQARLERIYETIRDIPPGCRQVGWALRHAPDGSNLPWHRVLRASGNIAFEPGSEYFKKQRALLIQEGVAVIAGRVDMRRYRWEPQLDELLWKPGSAWDER